MTGLLQVCGLLGVKRGPRKATKCCYPSSVWPDSNPAYPECQLGYHCAKSFVLVCYETFCHLWWLLTLSDPERTSEFNFTLAIFWRFSYILMQDFNSVDGQLLVRAWINLYVYWAVWTPRDETWELALTLCEFCCMCGVYLHISFQDLVPI
jgi:hypothetical protein